MFLLGLDGVDNTYTFPAEIIGVLILIAGCLIYLRFAPRRIALIALFSAAFAGLYITNIIGSVYWAQFMVDFSTGERWRIAESFELGDILSRLADRSAGDLRAADRGILRRKVFRTPGEHAGKLTKQMDRTRAHLTSLINGNNC